MLLDPRAWPSAIAADALCMQALLVRLSTCFSKLLMDAGCTGPQWMHVQLVGHHAALLSAGLACAMKRCKACSRWTLAVAGC